MKNLSEFEIKIHNRQFSLKRQTLSFSESSDKFPLVCAQKYWEVNALEVANG